jgi:SAM-dependent methyltransferase
MVAHYKSSYLSNTGEACWEVQWLADLPWADIRRIKRFVDLRDSAVLDVGCGSGIFLQALQRAGATNLVGIEPGAIAAQYARRRLPKATILEQTFETAEFGEAVFDLVTAINVIEHLYSPARFFAFVAWILKPGGLLYIRTPNWGAAKKYGVKWRGLHVDYEHVYYFDRLTLGNYLHRYGLVTIAVDYDPFTGGLGTSQAPLPLNGAKTLARHDALLVSRVKHAVTRAVPLIGTILSRFLWYVRRYWNWKDIRTESAHILIVIAQKADTGVSV